MKEGKGIREGRVGSGYLSSFISAGNGTGDEALGWFSDAYKHTDMRIHTVDLLKHKHLLASPLL